MTQKLARRSGSHCAAGSIAGGVKVGQGCADGCGVNSGSARGAGKVNPDRDTNQSPQENVFFVHDWFRELR